MSLQKKLSVLSDWPRFCGRYIRQHWQTLIVAAIAGIVAALAIRFIRRGSWLHPLLTFEDHLVLIWAELIIGLVLLLSWAWIVQFWRRWLRTLRMAQLPLLYLDLVAVFSLSLGLTMWSFVGVGTIALPVISRPVQLFLIALASLSAVWLLSSFTWAYRTRASTRFLQPSFPQQSLSSANGAGGDFPDEPIIEEIQDLLGRQTFVNKLYDQIIHVPVPKSFVFGLYGGWGEGKTSVLNLLLRRLANNPTVIPIAFNPWYLATEGALIQNFYASIERELEQRYLVPGLHRLLNRYRELLTFGLRSAGFSFQLPIRDDPTRLRGELESWIARSECRLVIVIDDIDRLQAAEALSVFKLVALSARLQHTIFILSFDDQVIRTMLQETAKVDPTFLDKVIQKPLPLPPAEPRDIDRFLLFSDASGRGVHRSALDQLFDELKIATDRRQEFDKKIVYFYLTHLRPLFPTLRQAKRYLNSLRATLPPIVDEVDLYDLVLLEILQVFFSAIYRDVWQNRWSYIPGWTNEAILSSPVGFAFAGNATQKYERIRERLEALLAYEEHADIARAILEEIFGSPGEK